MPLSLTLNREGATVPPDAAASRHGAVHRARRAAYPSADGPRRLRQGGGHLADPQGVRRTGGTGTRGGPQPHHGPGKRALVFAQAQRSQKPGGGSPAAGGGTGPGSLGGRARQERRESPTS